MRSTVHHLSVSAIRADALFVSALQRSDEPTAAEVREAVARAVHEFGGRGCAERVAQEFGDHPDIAVARMRWARQLADETFPSRGLTAARARLTGHRAVARTAA